MTFTAPSILDVHVKVQEGGRLKLSWSDPLKIRGERFYHIDGEQVSKISEKVRAALGDLVEAARTKKNRGACLRALATRGHELWEALFDSDGVGGKSALDVRDGLLPKRQKCLILVHADNRVYVPWGLIYDGDLEKLPADDDVSLNHYQDFWCIKYRISSLYEGVAAEGLDNVRRTSEVNMLTVVNADCWDKTTTKVPADERSLFERVWDRKTPPIKSSKEFYTEWRQKNKTLDLLYFYCHSNGDKLSLGGGGSEVDLIAMEEFRKKVRREVEYPICLVFLNGCQTAVGADNGGFLEATGRLGFCGFVGTEAKVPDLFALRFATDFFWHLLCEGRPVYEIFSLLREEHWPLSLLYTASCHPMFRITSDAAGVVTPKPIRNLSEQEILVEQTL